MPTRFFFARECIVTHPFGFQYTFPTFGWLRRHDTGAGHFEMGADGTETPTPLFSTRVDCLGVWGQTTVWFTQFTHTYTRARGDGGM